METAEVSIIKVISEHKRRRYAHAAEPGRPAYNPPAPGFKRVMAIVRFGKGRKTFTRHCDTRDGKIGHATIYV